MQFIRGQERNGQLDGRNEKACGGEDRQPKQSETRPTEHPTKGYQMRGHVRWCKSQKSVPRLAILASIGAAASAAAELHSVAVADSDKMYIQITIHAIVTVDCYYILCVILRVTLRQGEEL